MTFADTQSILNNVNIENITSTDISKIYCLRDGWNYLFDHIDDAVNLIFLETIHELTFRFDVLYQYLGKLRNEDVMISGTDWCPELPDADKILIANGKGIFNVPVKLDGLFKQKLVDYYESNDNEELKAWIFENCLDGVNSVK